MDLRIDARAAFGLAFLLSVTAASVAHAVVRVPAEFTLPLGLLLSLSVRLPCLFL